jgi:hypothetical protein
MVPHRAGGLLAFVDSDFDKIRDGVVVDELKGRALFQEKETYLKVEGVQWNLPLAQL